MITKIKHCQDDTSTRSTNKCHTLPSLTKRYGRAGDIFRVTAIYEAVCSILLVGRVLIWNLLIVPFLFQDQFNECYADR